MAKYAKYVEKYKKELISELKLGYIDKKKQIKKDIEKISALIEKSSRKRAYFNFLRRIKENGKLDNFFKTMDVIVERNNISIDSFQKVKSKINKRLEALLFSDNKKCLEKNIVEAEKVLIKPIKEIVEGFYASQIFFWFSKDENLKIMKNVIVNVLSKLMTYDIFISSGKLDEKRFKAIMNERRKCEYITRAFIDSYINSEVLLSYLLYSLIDYGILAYYEHGLTNSFCHSFIEKKQRVGNVNIFITNSLIMITDNFFNRKIGFEEHSGFMFSLSGGNNEEYVIAINNSLNKSNDEKYQTLQHEIQHIFNKVTFMSLYEFDDELSSCVAEYVFPENININLLIDIIRESKNKKKGNFSLTGAAFLKLAKSLGKRALENASEKEIKNKAKELLNEFYWKKCGLTYDEIIEPFEKTFE